MSEVIVWNKLDGTVAITHPVIEGDIHKIARHAQKQDPSLEGLSYTVVSKNELPSDREFRDAWEHKQAKININLNRAKDIHLNKLREIRNKKLEQLDKETMKNINNTQKFNEIESLKQSLRDLPININLDFLDIHTIEDLKIYSPEVLK